MSLDFRALRIKAGKTQKEAADACSVSKRTLIRWEQGDSDDIPHGKYVRLVSYLEETIRLRKEIAMAKEYGRTGVVFDEPEDEEGTDQKFTVSIPDGLEENFTPSKAVTDRQMLDWATKHKEPYPGFAEEFERWDSGWADVASRQREQDSGQEDLRVESVHPQPEQDADGNQYIYRNEAIVNEINDPGDPGNGNEDVYIPQDSDGNDLDTPEREAE